MDLFSELKLINLPGIYLLVDEAKKLAYINYSSNIAGALIKHLSSNKFENWEFKVLEIVTDNPIRLRIRCQYFKDLYSSNTYEIINFNRASNLKLFIDPIKDFRLGFGNHDLLRVKIVSKGYRDFVVGIFNDYVELDEFLQKYYARNLVTDLIYADNDLTREYLKWKQP